MPIDALFLTAVTRELTDKLLGCRVDRVQQPERDTLILSLRSPGLSCRLLLSASCNHPRIHLTETAMENPAQTIPHAGRAPSAGAAGASEP